MLDKYLFGMIFNPRGEQINEGQNAFVTFILKVFDWNLLKILKTLSSCIRITLAAKHE